MKTEVGTFSAGSNNVTVFLNDTTLNVKGIFLQISPLGITSNPTTGFGDGITNRSGCPLDMTYCITAYSGTTNKLAGKTTSTSFSTPGQFSMYFFHYDPSYNIDFMVVGD